MTDSSATGTKPRDGRGRWRPRGRIVEATARAEILELLGDRGRTADLLIEHLHLIQDRHGHLSAAHLAALAEEMRLPQAAVYEVATFYAHFDVVREGETPPAPTTVRVCDSLVCAMHGADALVSELEAEAGPDVRVVRAPCMGRCDERPRRRRRAPGGSESRRWRAVLGTVTALARSRAMGRRRISIDLRRPMWRAAATALLRDCLAGARAASTSIYTG